METRLRKARHKEYTSHRRGAQVADEKRRGIVCEKCGGQTAVYKVRRPANGIIMRRRKCLSCGHRMGTVERIKSL